MSGSNARAERRRKENQPAWHYDHPTTHTLRPLKVKGPPREPSRIRSARQSYERFVADKKKEPS